VNFPLVGKRIPAKVKEIITANKDGAWEFKDNQLSIAGEVLKADEFSLKLEAKPEFAGKIAPLSTNDGLVLLELNLTSELIQEGIARDLIRAVQQQRKSADLNITDKIILAFKTNDSEIKQAIVNWQAYIQEQTLCVKIADSLPASATLKQEKVEMENGVVTISLSKV